MLYLSIASCLYLFCFLQPSLPELLTQRLHSMCPLLYFFYLWAATAKNHMCAITKLKHFTFLYTWHLRALSAPRRVRRALLAYAFVRIR